MASSDKGMLAARNISFSSGGSFGPKKHHGPNRPVYALFVFAAELSKEEKHILAEEAAKKLDKFHHGIFSGYMKQAQAEALLSGAGIAIAAEDRKSQYFIIALWAEKKKAVYRLDTIFSKGAIDGYMGYVYDKTDASRDEFETYIKEAVIVENSPVSHSAKILMRAVTWEYIYAVTGLIVGLMAVIMGVILFFRGVSGSSSWVAKLMGLESQISDAPPGVILFVVGLFVVLVTKPKVTLDNLKG